MIVAEVGCHRATSAAQIESAIAQGVRQASIVRCQVGLIAIPAMKGTERGIQPATARLHAPRIAVGPVSCALRKGTLPS